MADIIELTATDGFKFPAFEVRPTGRPKGAVVVLQEIFGLNSHIRAVTEAFAAQGYLALAPSTFHRVQPDVDMGYSPQDVAAGVALKAAVEALPPRSAVRSVPFLRTLRIACRIFPAASFSPR